VIPVDELLTLLPAQRLDQLAVACRVNAPNQIRLSGQTVFVCLLNCLANHPMLTQRLLEETFTSFMGRPTDHTSFGKRLKVIKPAFFEAAFVHLYRQIQPQMTAGDARALRLRFVDATVVTLSSKLLQFGIHVGTKGKGPIRYDKHQVKGVFELSEEGMPQCLHLCTEQREANDSHALGDPMIEAAQPGDLFVFDRGCSDRHRLLKIHARQAFFLTPRKDQRLRTLKVLWQAPDPPEFPPAAAPAAVSKAPAGAGASDYRLVRVEQAVFENSNDAVSPKARAQWAAMPLIVLYGERYDQRTQRWKAFVLMTNLPLSEDGQRAGPYLFAELAELYRLRWTIEIFFRFLKQYLGYAHLASRNENGIRVLIWMSLITALLLVWYRYRTGIDRGWRSVKFWFAEDAREWTRALLRRDLTPQLQLE